MMIAALLVGCAQERPVINRVQAVALQKAFFVGPNLRDIADDPEFYMRGVIVDVGYGASQDGLFTSTYAQPTSRIRWEITENTLNARLAYERIQGTDSRGRQRDGLRKKTSNDGQVVASYRILSHFDIRRAYNPTTGEQINVTEENSVDRPWYEREYFRVDWSQNLVTDAYDFDTLSQMGIYGGIKYDPIPYAVTDEKHPDAPHFDLGQSYFDITTKAFAMPGSIDLSHLGWGIDRFPSCWLPPEFMGGSAPTGNCNPIELTLRHSFKKVVDTDYEPVDYDGMRFQAFGYFLNEYKGYDRNYGMVDNRWFRFAARYNIWNRSHYYSDPDAMTGEIACNVPETTAAPTGNLAADPNRDDNGDGTSDECEAVTSAVGAGGSRCDVFKGRCTLPYQKREHKTIPWYINGDTGEDLFEASDWGVMEWNVALKTAVQTAKLVECRKTNGDDCDGRFPMWTGQQDDNDEAARIEKEYQACLRANQWNNRSCEGVLNQQIRALASERGVSESDPNVRAIREIVAMPSVIVLCHNPVTDRDAPACGPVGTAPRMGDLRYHTVLVVEKPQTPSPWGIYADSEDPITGEKVAASINIWSHITDLAATGLLDIVRYIHKEIGIEEITNGKYVHNWVQAQRVAAGGGGMQMTSDEVIRRLASVAKVEPARFAEIAQTRLPDAVADALRQAKHKALDAAAHVSVPSSAQAAVEARMNLVRGTPTEAKLLNPAILKVAGIPSSMPISGPIAQMASPFGLNNPKFRAQLRNLREVMLAKRGACILHEAPEMSALTGLADVLKRKFPAMDNETPAQQFERNQRIFRYLRRRLHYAVIGHEMGHSVGLRHNFVSSYGALHFRPQYWQLRTKNGTVSTACTGAPNENAENCVGPRYYDSVTADEQNQLIWMFMQSTVMDYPGDISQDMIGLGAYDYAAARMLYGDVVSVYAEPQIVAGSRLGAGISSATDTFGGLAGIQYSVLSGRELQTIHYSQLQKEYGVIRDCYTASPSAPSWWKSDVDGEWDQVLDGMVVSVNGAPTKCRQMPVDYLNWTQLRKPTETELRGGYYRGGPSVEDSTGRVRVPYHFASDNWADLGNVSVFRHDNGADPYEQVMFLITTAENRHIFDNFRRGRTAFSIKGAADRSFSRYNEKLVNIAGGMAFYVNIYKNFAPNTGYTFDTLWPYIAGGDVKDQMLAATVAFDHLTRQIARPEDGEHYLRDAPFADPVLRSNKDPDGADNPAIVKIPNGATGFLRDVGIGGRPIENALSEDHGDFDVEYDMNAGSYYDKIYAIIHLSISEDRFISQSRGDFYDARFRANGFADLFPDGWRRVVANSLVGDRAVMAPYLVADSSGNPELDADGFPARPMGHVSWWPASGPVVCFPSDGKNACKAPDGLTMNLRPDSPTRIVPVDPQIGFEVQKFIIAYGLAYIAANQHTSWADLMRVYRTGPDANPELAVGHTEWQDPLSQEKYYARTFGRECLFGTGATCANGKMVEKGIAARVLEWANYLTSKAYKLDTVNYPASPGKPAGFNQFGQAMIVRHPDGTPVVAVDPAQRTITPAGLIGPPKTECDRNINQTCTPLTMLDNRYAMDLEAYKSVVDFLWEMVIRFRLGSPHELGFY
jgi:hypothetical protein